MAGRRTALASLAGQKVDDVPGQSDPLLLRLPLTQLVPTRFNPRRNFGTEDQLKEFGLVLKKRQLQPAVVVSRSAYLKLWPDEAENVGAAHYVIANGERRYRGSRAAGLTHLDVVHREEVAASRADFLDAVLSENNDREDLDPIERALGIETMVIEIGGARKVAEHYGKHETWVSQQRKLLKLTDELQELVSAGAMPIRVARDIAGLPRSEQASAWAAESKARETAKAAPRVRRSSQAQPALPAESSNHPANEKDSQAVPAAEQRQVAVPAQGQQTAVPDPADTESVRDFTAVKSSSPENGNSGPASAAPEPAAVVLPWRNPSAVAQILRERMEPEDVQRLAKELAEPS